MKKINFKKYFEEAKKNNIEPYQISYVSSIGYAVEIFNGEIDTQIIGNEMDISAKGIVNGKQGSFATDAIDKLAPSLMAKKVKENAIYGKEDREDNYFKGGMKYKKAKCSLKEFKTATIKELTDFALEIYNNVKGRDERVNQISVSVSMDETFTQKENSYGLKCYEKSTCYRGSVEVVATDSTGDTRTGGRSFISYKDIDDLRVHAMSVIDDAISSSVDFFNAKAPKSKKYNVVFERGCFSTLLNEYISQLNAKSVQKHLSVFEGKLNTQIASKCLTVKNMPFLLSSASTSYDADGYPTSSFTVIDKGILKTYFYSIETAREMNATPNGCAVSNGNGSIVLKYVKPGKFDLDALLSKLKNGIYITSISGLNSGINSQTQDFSLPCEGYIIKDGKKDKTVSMMVMVGNLKDVFNSIKYIGNDIEPERGRYTPSALVKGLSISGQ